MKSLSEIELKFIVPRASRAKLLAEMARRVVKPERISLAALYLDTEDRRLAQERIAWRLRREGRRWVQTLKATGTHALQRFEHEVPRPGPVRQASEHAGTPVGDRLIALLKRADSDGMEVQVRFQTEVRRTIRRVQTRGAYVEIAFDEGRVRTDGLTAPICEVEFELVSGSPGAMLVLVERWRKRFGLVYDPRSKAERGDRLADGSQFPALRKAAAPIYAKNAIATEAFASVLDECLAQISRNAIGLVQGDPIQRADHVHQLRVGIRRLRSALRSFRGWTPQPPPHLVEGLRALFSELGLARDSDVLGNGVATELAKVGAPPITLPEIGMGTDPVATILADGVQELFLAWIAWRVNLDIAAGPLEGEGPKLPDADGTLSIIGRAEHASVHVRDAQFRRQIERRLKTWHHSIAKAWQGFDELDESQLHALRKRIKRQRYAVEFFSPALRRRPLNRYLDSISIIQDKMGDLNDLFVARTFYQSLVKSNSAAWFALGWLAARIKEVRALAKPELGRLARERPPSARAS